MSTPAKTPALADPGFAARLLAWFDVHGRHDLPWQRPRTAYRVWISEVMLQQTQVQTVVPYFLRFVERFSDAAMLAAAPLDEVLLLWAGLGYYARARNLHRAAQLIVERHGGQLPVEFDALLDLPGIGRSTAGAILAQAHGARYPILDGNVRRVLARRAAVAEWPGLPGAARELWRISENLLPHDRLADYTQALMDLGASLCTPRAPACDRCPVSLDCAAYRANRVAEFPAPRPLRARPLRRASALLIENSVGEILLERRPPAGIWGGLWCLPLVEEGGDAQQVMRDHYGLRSGAQQELPSLRHAFTHFELELSPLRLKVAGSAPSIGEGAGQRWVKIGDPLPALPAPISKLFHRLRECPEPSTA